MASKRELVALCRGGAIGTLLAERTRGELGHLFPNKDSDFLVLYPSESAVPDARCVEDLIKKHFSQLGYKVSREGDSHGVFWGKVIYDGQLAEDFCALSIVATTKFPNPGGRPCIRVTCNII